MNFALSAIKWVLWPFAKQQQQQQHTVTDRHQFVPERKGSSSDLIVPHVNKFDVVLQYAYNYGSGLANLMFHETSVLTRVWVRVGANAQTRVPLYFASSAASSLSPQYGQQHQFAIPPETTRVFLEYLLRDGGGGTRTYRICCTPHYYRENKTKLLGLPYGLNTSADLESSSSSAIPGSPTMLRPSQTVSSFTLQFRIIVDKEAENQHEEADADPSLPDITESDNPKNVVLGAIDLTDSLTKYAGVNSDFHNQPFNILFCLLDAIDDTDITQNPCCTQNAQLWTNFVRAQLIQGNSFTFPELVFVFTNALGQTREISHSQTGEKETSICPFTFEKLFPSVTTTQGGTASQAPTLNFLLGNAFSAAIESSLLRKGGCVVQETAVSALDSDITHLSAEKKAETERINI